MSAKSFEILLVRTNSALNTAWTCLWALSLMSLQACVESLEVSDTCLEIAPKIDSLHVQEISVQGNLICSQDKLQDSIQYCSLQLLPSTASGVSVMNSLDTSKIQLWVDSTQISLQNHPWIPSYSSCENKILSPVIQIPQTTRDTQYTLSWKSPKDSIQQQITIENHLRRPEIQIQSTDSTVTIQAKAFGFHQFVQHRLHSNTDIQVAQAPYAAITWNLSAKDLGSQFSCGDTTKFLSQASLVCFTQNYGNTSLKIDQKTYHSSQEYCSTLDSAAQATFFKLVRQSCESSAI
jgi:hypothetical protein